MLPWHVPVDPEPPEARQWLVDELSKPQYQAAKPTLFDQIAKAISEGAPGWKRTQPVCSAASGRWKTIDHAPFA